MLMRRIGLIALVLPGLLLINTASAELVAHWSFDGDATDSSGNGHNGTEHDGPIYVAGQREQAIEFDGVSSHVTVPHSDDLSFGPSDAFSIVAWVYPTSLPGHWAGVVTKSRDRSNWYGIWINPNDHWVFGLQDDNKIGSAVEAGSWTHVAATFDDGQIKIYLNGELDHQATTNRSPAGIGDVAIGAALGVPEFLRGLVDEAAIYNHALTKEEILSIMLSAEEAYPFASRPFPQDGAVHVDMWVNLSWLSGDSAISHDVYFSDSLDDVNEGAAGAFQGNQPIASYIAGLAGFAFPEGLEPGTTYYWRVDEVNEADPDSPWKGPVWSFQVPSKLACNASPADGARFVPLDAILTWTGGFGAKLHTVYFGDSLEEVSNAAGGLAQGDATYDPGPLELNKTYYWRVDEFDPPLTHRGGVWSFTTAIEGLGTAVMERWEDIDGSEIELLKNDPNYPDNPDLTETVTQFAWNGPNMNYYGARLEAWLYVPLTGDYTFWLNSDNQGELWLSTDDDPSNVILIARESSRSDLDYWGSGEEQSDPVSLLGGEKYYISALWKESGGSDHCQVAWQGPGVRERAIIQGSYLSPFEPMAAFGAKPANRAVGATQTPVLRWKPGLEAVSHEVYFGTDEEAVGNATIESPEYQGPRSLGDEIFDPGKLPWQSTFFWRVDEVNDLNPASPWVGNVWKFTTAGFLIMEDFEDYTDDDTTDGAIWQHWFDGFGVGANGSQVGYVSPPFAERKIVHGGRQSMPLSYNNTAGVTNSEAELMLDSQPRDWTEGGVVTLSIWFHGRPASVGSFMEEPAGTFTITGSGEDIWGTADEFHFAYKRLTGAGTIIARIDSVQDTADWAKAGVMIRETLDPGSKHVLAAVTSGEGVVSEGRVETDGVTFNYTEEEITAPRWVKLHRDKAGNFTAAHSSDGSKWVPVKGAAAENIPMRTTVYVGLAVTAYGTNLTCEAVFSDVTIVGNVSPEQWINQDIGIASNVASPMYVAISNAAGLPAVVTHADADAALTKAWTEWTIDLSRFSDQGIDLSDVDRIAIGLGAKADPTATGGSGVVFFDDITLHRPVPPPRP